MYQRALLTTDGSEVARAAFPHVKQILDPSGTVVVVQVIDDVARVLTRTTPAGFEFGSNAIGVDIAEDIVAEQRREAEQHLEEARQALEQDGIASVETVVLSGLPGDAIVAEVRNQGCDVVVMATHGRSGLRRTVLGSVADHVLRHLDDIPVVLVHPGH